MTVTAVASDDDEPRKVVFARLVDSMQNSINVIEEIAARLPVVVPAQTAAYLVAGHLDFLYVDDQAEGCCPECCAPCRALKQLLDAGQLDNLARPYYEGEGRDSEVWLDGRVDREFLNRAWRMTNCHDEIQIYRSDDDAKDDN
jgi:hypothetical protein